MTIDEAIVRFEETAKYNQKVADTHYISDNTTIDEIYCDDTEIIEEVLAGYQKHAEECRQVAEWLKELKVLREQTRWIPVSERLPDECETVLGTTRYNNLYKTDWWDDCGEIKWNTRDSTDTPIVAWMPLPEPYETEQEVEE